MSGLNLTAAFTYDALGRRGTQAVNGATTATLYDGWNPIALQAGGEHHHAADRPKP